MNVEQTLAKVLKANGLSLAVAESCTGGLIGHIITQMPGSSAYFLGGVVAYSNSVKESVLGVRGGLLQEHGAVSGEVAVAMAEGVRNLIRADLGLSVTGIAGPGGATPQKEVGLVYVAVAGCKGTACRRHRFQGDRGSIKSQAAREALGLLIDYMTK